VAILNPRQRRWADIDFFGCRPDAHVATPLQQQGRKVFDFHVSSQVIL
jgi:hypothetical protein